MNVLWDCRATCSTTSNMIIVRRQTSACQIGNARVSSRAWPPSCIGGGVRCQRNNRSYAWLLGNARMQLAWRALGGVRSVKRHAQGALPAECQATDGYAGVEDDTACPGCGENADQPDNFVVCLCVGWRVRSRIHGAYCSMALRVRRLRDVDRGPGGVPAHPGSIPDRSGFISDLADIASMCVV